MTIGGIFLYPTDTIWGIGCLATDNMALEKVFNLKQRVAKKSVIVLMSDTRMLRRYIASPIPDLEGFIEQFQKPTTVIYGNAIGLADKAIARDGTCAVRITSDPFCKALIKRIQKPIVSTSANRSGSPAPSSYRDIEAEIVNGIDYNVRWRQNEIIEQTASQLLKLKQDGSYDVLR